MMFKGSGVAITTPFDSNGDIDFDAFGKHIDFLIENQTDAIVVCGTTGEASTMTVEEHIETVSYCVKRVAKRVPVIAGCGSNNTSKTVDLALKCQDVGVDGLLVVTPYYNKTSYNGLIAHFAAVDSAVSIPIMLYNVPSRTNMNITPKIAKELAKLPNVVAIKDACGDIGQITLLSKECDLDIYTGNDDQVTATMAVGGVGVVTVAGNILPKQMHDMTHEFLNGNVKKSLEIQHEILDVINNLFIEVNPIPVKKALALMGMMENNLRLPLVPITEENGKVLESEMKKIGLV